MRVPTARFFATKAHWVVLSTLAVFATALAPMIGSDQRNYLVIAFAGLVSPIFLISHGRIGKDFLWGTVVVLYLLLHGLILGDEGDLSSIGYTAMFVLTYIAFASALATYQVPGATVLAMLRWLILAFAAVSIMQLLASVVGLPIPNLMLTHEYWSFNSLAVEPSHLARILSMTVLAYLALAHDSHEGVGSVWRLLWRERLLLLAFFTAILLSDSSLGIVVGPLALLLAFPGRWTAFFFVALFAAWPLLYALDLPAVKRAVDFLAALPTMNIFEIAQADQSGAVRVMPMLVYLKEGAGSDWGFWFGEGLGAIKPYLSGELIGVSDDAVGAGFFPGFFIAFGVVGAALTIFAFVGRLLHRATFNIALLLILLSATVAWNTQIFWYGLMLLRLVYHYQVAEPARMRRWARGGQQERAPDYAAVTGRAV